jgi:hypothetical protein
MMVRTRIVSLAVALSLGAMLMGAVADVQAQDASDTATAAPTSAASDKAAARAQRKAARKAARAKKNAELSAIEKNGTNPSGPKLTAPANTLSAESKSNPPAPAHKKKAMAASTPDAASQP